MSTCTDCNGTGAVPAGGGEDEGRISNGLVPCETCRPRTCLHISADGAIEPFDLPADPTAIYHDLRARLGGYLEPVYLPGAVMYCNEDGKILGLPMNLRASRLLAASRGYDARTWDLTTIHRAVGDIIVGEAVLVGRDDTPDEVGLDAEALEFARAAMGAPGSTEGS